jgi:phosphoribosylglycinamide formyltransferase-1
MKNTTPRQLEFSRIAFLASHGGSSARRVIHACGNELQATPVIIVSNNPESSIVEFALQHGIRCEVVNVKQCGSDQGVEQRLLELFTELRVDLVVLSGYMKKLGATLVQRFAGRIVNIHPSLLPKYGGPGMYGMNVHQAVVAAGEPETGITIHEVNEHYDEGAVIAQMTISVLPGESAETLSERVKAHEPEFLVRTLAMLQTGAKTGITPG